MTTVLVTGGAGFIGSNIVERLLRDDYSVKVIDNFSTGNKDNLKEFMTKIKFIEGDIRNIETVNNAMKDVDFVLHQAALPSVPRSIKNPLETNEVNINGTLNILESARKNNVKRIVYASSSSVYGDIKELPKKESMILKPLSPYAVTKLAMEYYFDVFNKVYGMKSVGLRYFNVYGPRQSPDSQYAAVIPLFIKNSKENKSSIIYGDGEQTRDFSFIEDVVNANILGMKSKCIGHEALNIAKGERISLNTLIGKINSLLGKDVKPNYNEPREGDILHSLADISKAREKIGYSPEYSIDEGLKKTIKWFEEKHV